MNGEQSAPGRAAPGHAAPARHSLGVLLDNWRDQLGAWAIPDRISHAVTESPWVLPRQVFARRADRLAAAPQGPSYWRAWSALDPPGSVLDVGVGAGAACIPLLPRTTALTAVDTDQEMLELLAERASALAGKVRLVHGTWPDAAPDAAPADVVTCFNVVYNAPDILPFLAALTASARRLVVTEMTAEHPMVSMNALWLRFHGLRRPEGPTADDLLAILAAMGIQAGHARWQRPGGADYASFAELVDVTRRRLCLAADRADDVAQALVEDGTDPDHPVDLGTARRDVVTIWWAGSAAGRDYLE
ncbi:MAG TPA: class I SAM-dependent methyltransferase [Streptosporangiaceae bacterium]|nr:class I SAM-dependent methyltransferase [Streptosporangiaceae bacterium]